MSKKDETTWPTVTPINPLSPNTAPVVPGQFVPLDRPCMFEQIAEQDRRNGFTGTRVLGLVCTCPKCTTWC